MVQNMLRNDPRFANDPMISRTIDEMINNPDMVSQMGQIAADPMVQQMMQNPEYMQQFMQRMNPGSGGGGGVPAGTGGNLVPPPMLNAEYMQQYQQYVQQLMGAAVGNTSNTVPGGDGTATATGLPQWPTMSLPPPGGTTGTNSNRHRTTDNRNANNDTEQTEEEMIAEAIRRSLQDNNGGS
jgi:hypothetical protein